jgi:CRP/FNR family cyclic AMP-dependent transcriptional regulator
MFQGTAIFPQLSQTSLDLMATCGVVRKYSKNSVLVSEGELSDSLYIILDGKVKVYVSDEHGKEVLLNILGKGTYFGELSLIDDEPRSASVVTVEYSQIAVVSKTDFQHCLAAHSEIALELIAALVKRVRALTDSVKNLALLDVYGRVARTLISLAHKQNDKLIIEQRLTHQDIASMVGASREMVSRIMKDLTTGGYIEMKDRQIIIRGKLPPGW